MLVGEGTEAPAPTTLALMHGSSFTGDAANALRALADAYDARYLART